MKEVTRILDFDVVERRIYDESGKLIEIRKEEKPSSPIKKHFFGYRPQPGSAGGHE